MANLQVFLRWVALGGMMRGISLTESATLPTTFLRDIQYFSSVYGRLTEEKRESEKASKKPKAKF